MATLSQSFLRRFVLRALQALDRHEDRDPSLLIYVGTLGITAPAFAEALDRALAAEVARSEKTGVKLVATATLHRTLRSWTASLINDIETLDRRRAPCSC